MDNTRHDYRLDLKKKKGSMNGVCQWLCLVCHVFSKAWTGSQDPPHFHTYCMGEFEVQSTSMFLRNGSKVDDPHKFHIDTERTCKKKKEKSTQTVIWAQVWNRDPGAVRQQCAQCVTLLPKIVHSSLKSLAQDHVHNSPWLYRENFHPNPVLYLKEIVTISWQLDVTQMELLLCVCMTILVATSSLYKLEFQDNFVSVKKPEWFPVLAGGG